MSVNARSLFSKATLPGWVLIFLSVLRWLYALVDAWSNLEFISEKVRSAPLLAWTASLFASPLFQVSLIVVGLAWIALASRRLDRRERTTPPDATLPAHELFTVDPVNTWGENIYQTTQADGNGEFLVCAHFILWSKHTVEIVNVDLLYGARNMPGRQTIVFDNRQPEPTDASFRLQHRTRVEAGSLLDVRIGRDFMGRPSEHHGPLTVTFEVSSPEWPGIRHLEVGGRLAAGGELAGVKVVWRDNAA